MFTVAGRTLGVKVTILSAEILELIVSIWIVRHSSMPATLSWTILAMDAIIFLRMNAMMFLWLPRGIGWNEAVGNITGFALYYVGMPIFALWRHPWWLMFAAGILLFLAGSTLNTTAELLRRPFRANPVNKGKLYTGGLFRYAIHINYLGDVIWVLGLALTTMNPWALTVPAVLLLVFVFRYIPAADAHMESHYADQFRKYQAHTKELIPGIW